MKKIGTFLFLICVSLGAQAGIIQYEFSGYIEDASDIQLFGGDTDPNTQNDGTPFNLMLQISEQSLPYCCTTTDETLLSARYTFNLLLFSIGNDIYGAKSKFRVLDFTTIRYPDAKFDLLNVNLFGIYLPQIKQYHSFNFNLFGTQGFFEKDIFSGPQTFNSENIISSTSSGVPNTSSPSYVSHTKTTEYRAFVVSEPNTVTLILVFLTFSIRQLTKKVS